MTNAAFTPGPWEAVEATEHHGFYVAGPFGNTVCDLYTMSRLDMPSTANGGPSKPVPFMHEMDGPNAHLIAAAPDLYEALEAIMDERWNPAGRSEDVSDMARAALAKARGEAA